MYLYVARSILVLYSVHAGSFQGFERYTCVLLILLVKQGIFARTYRRSQEYR